MSFASRDQLTSENMRQRLEEEKSKPPIEPLSPAPSVASFASQGRYTPSKSFGALKEKLPSIPLNNAPNSPKPRAVTATQGDAAPPTPPKAGNAPFRRATS